MTPLLDVNSNNSGFASLNFSARNGSVSTHDKSW